MIHRTHIGSTRSAPARQESSCIIRILTVKCAYEICRYNSEMRSYCIRCDAVACGIQLGAWDASWMFVDEHGGLRGVPEATRPGLAFLDKRQRVLKLLPDKAYCNRDHVLVDGQACSAHLPP